MSCYGCTQKIIEENAAKNKIIKDAFLLAKNTGQTFAIYTDGTGQQRCIRADLASGYPVTAYVSPQMRDADL